MPAPSKLAIATGSVLRLVKEDGSYQKEQTQQEERIKNLKGNTDENADYQLRQENQALEETKRIFPDLHKRLRAAIAKLEEELASAKAGSAPSEEIEKAEGAVTSGNEVLGE